MRSFACRYAARATSSSAIASEREYRQVSSESFIGHSGRLGGGNAWITCSGTLSSCPKPAGFHQYTGPFRTSAARRCHCLSASGDNPAAARSDTPGTSVLMESSTRLRASNCPAPVDGVLVSAFFASDWFTALLFEAEVVADLRGLRHERPIPTTALGVRERTTDGTAALLAHFTQPRPETTLATASIFVVARCVASASQQAQTVHNNSGGRRALTVHSPLNCSPRLVGVSRVRMRQLDADFGQCSEVLGFDSNF
jgi:hypothetical protein